MLVTPKQKVAKSSNLVHGFPVTSVPDDAILRPRGQRSRSKSLTELRHRIRQNS